MPHNIDKMAYVGKVPWHGLGTPLPANADYDSIVEAAGFYRAIEREISAPPLEGTIPDRKALFREDTSQYLATVHRSYQVIQFEEVAHTLVTAAGGVRCIFHTAGTLGHNGVRGWLLGELPDVIRVRGDKSPIKKYVLAYTGHDGITPIVIKNVATRVVCQNTVGVALGEEGAEWHINHTSNAKERLEEAGKAFRRLIEGYEYFAELANNLSTIRVSEHQLHKILDVVMPVLSPTPIRRTSWQPSTGRTSAGMWATPTALATDVSCVLTRGRRPKHAHTATSWSVRPPGSASDWRSSPPTPR